MKPRFTRFSALLLAFASLTSYGKTVDENTARTTGCNYLMQRNVQGVQSPTDLELSYTATSQIAGKTVADYYVFNIVGGNGFVLVTADDNVMPVLAYSAEQSFNYNRIAPAAAYWVDNYKRLIAYVIENHLNAQEGVSEQWQSLKSFTKQNVAAKTTSVTPLLTTKWDQAPYYNQYCPGGSGSSKCVTGCGATAMAQIMKFHNWPVVGMGMHSFYHPSYGNLSANFGTTTYQWSSMPNSITSNNPAVGTLMYHCGVSVNMDYGTASAGGSSSYVGFAASKYVNNAEYALKTYFKYKPTVKTLYRNGDQVGYTPAYTSYTTTAWIAALQAELNAGRPILYTGQGAGGGHAWVCDGFQSSDNKMHFNWGWGGSGPDGYYSVDNVAPPSLGTGGGGGNFNDDQTATINIEPDTYPTYTDNIKMKNPVNFSTSLPVAYNGAITFKTKFMNGRTTAFAGDFCAQLFDATTNNYVTTLQTITGQSIAAGDSSAQLTFSATGVKRLVSAAYTLKLMYRNTGVTAWSPVGNNGTIYNYAMVDVKNDTSLRMYGPTTVTSGLPIAIGGPLNLSMKVYNASTTAFSGSMRLQLTNVSTGTAYVITTEPGVNIPSYMPVVGGFAATNTAPAGWYALEVQHQFNSTGTFYSTGSKDYPNPILVNVGVVDVAEIESMKHQVLVFPNPAKDMVTVMFNDNNVSRVIISDISGRVIENLPADPNASSMQIPVSNYAAGTYIAQFVTDKETITQKISITK